MKVICLPGLTQKTNEGEHVGLVRSLDAAGHRVIDYRWTHWRDPGTEWNLEREIGKVAHLAEEDAEDMAMVAKSIATFVVTSVLHRNLQLRGRIGGIVFIGVPIRDTQLLEPSLYRTVFASPGGLGSKLTILQHDRDPHGTTGEIRRAFLPDAEGKVRSDGAVEIVELSGDNHAYDVAERVTGLIGRMVGT